MTTDIPETGTTEEHSTNDAHEVIVHEDQGTIGTVAGQFGVNVPGFLGQLVNFLIVLAVLWAFVYRPITKLLDERKETIANSVRQAEEIEARLKAVEEEREGILLAAKKEAQGIAQTAQEQAEAKQKKGVAQAKREVERVVIRGKMQLAEEKKHMIREMKKDIVDIAMKAASRVVQDGFDEKRSQSLTEEVVRKMTKTS